MEDTLKRSSSVIEGGQQSPTCANETGTGFAPLMEDKGLFVFEGTAGRGRQNGWVVVCSLVGLTC